MKAFQNLLVDFKQHNTQVLGINTDSIESHLKVVKKFGLEYPLLSDQNSTLAKQLNIAKPGLFSGELKQSGRHTFIIKNGNILKEYRSVKSPGEHPKIVLDFLKNN